jgi:hypothetical protein
MAKRVKGLILDDQQWAALLELVGARVVDLRGTHGLRQDFFTGPGLFNVVWPADDKLLAVFAQLVRMGLAAPELVEGFEAEYVSRDAAAENGVEREAIAGEWGACAKPFCPLCAHAPLGFFLDEADAKLVEDAAAKVKAKNPKFDAIAAPLTGDEGPEQDPGEMMGEEEEPAPAPSQRPAPAMPRSAPGPSRQSAPPSGSGIVVPATATVVPEKPAEPEPVGPPLEAVDIDGRVVLRVPADRWSLDLVTKLGSRDAAAIRPADKVSSEQRDRIARQGAGFVAALPFFSEAFLEGKPLDKKRFEADSKEIAPGVRALEAQLPRFGTALVVVSAKGKFLTSEVALTPDRLLALLS